MVLALKHVFAPSRPSVRAPLARRSFARALSALWGAINRVRRQRLGANAQTALRSSTAAASIRLIADTVGSLPIRVFERGPDGSKERALEHPAATVLSGDANPWTGAAELRTALQMDSLLHKRGGFAQVIRVGGEVRELHRLNPTAVTPEVDGATGEPRYRLRLEGGGERVLSYCDVIHIQTPGATCDRPSTRLGCSPTVPVPQVS
jgi:phage portal protein BeeE